MIISISRRTDIPAFYSEWFFNRVREGFVKTRNPFNPEIITEVSLKPGDVDCMVFWSKNPENLINRISELDEYQYYFLFTITPYESDLEPNLPDKKEIITTFISLSELIGKNRVIWRYDPILLNEKYSINYHEEAFSRLAEKLGSSTCKCIISFITMYNKSKRNLQGTGVRSVTEDEKLIISQKLKRMSDQYGIILETCAEPVDLGSVGISAASCIDIKLIEHLAGKKLNIPKDKNQRENCGCTKSTDIGAYNTCMHQCLYCYANQSHSRVEANFHNHHVKSPYQIGS